MKRALAAHSIHDSWRLLASCCGLVAAFICLRVWIASHIKFDAFVKIFSEGLKFFQGLLPVPIEDLASPLGRVAFSFEEFPTLVLMGLWTVARGTECIVGRVGDGTMEMLLAQPIRRASLIGTHALVTLSGVAALSVAAWLGCAAGMAIADFDAPPELTALVPAAFNYLGFGVFMLGVTTLISAVARTRSQAVGIVIGFYVVELTLMILGRLTDRLPWLDWFTVFSAYEPTLLTLGLSREPAGYWPLFWKYALCLFGLGAVSLTAATAIFCRRDVPAPL